MAFLVGMYATYVYVYKYIYIYIGLSPSPALVTTQGCYIFTWEIPRALETIFATTVTGKGENPIHVFMKPIYIYIHKYSKLYKLCIYICIHM